MKRYLSIYKEMMAQSIKVNLAYRADLLIGILSFVAIQAVGLFSIRLMFNYIQVLAGWTFEEVLLIYGLFQIPRGIDHLLTDNVWLIPQHVRKGTFDKYLTKPLNVLFHICAEKFQFEAFGELIFGLGILIYLFPKLGMSLSFLGMLILIVYILVGTVIYFSIKLTAATLSFWMKDVFPIMVSMYEISHFTQRPINIYPTILKGFLSYVLPFAFTAYYPALFILSGGRVDWTLLQSLIIGILFILVSYRFWLYGVQKYESAGS